MHKVWRSTVLRGALLFFKVFHLISRSHGGKKSPFLTRFESFRTAAQVWIHRCLWNDAQSLMWYRRGALFFSRSSIKFQGHTGQKNSPILTRIEYFETLTPVWIHQWIWNDAQSLTYYRRGALLFCEVIHQISRPHRLKNRQQSNLSKITRPVADLPYLLNDHRNESWREQLTTNQHRYRQWNGAEQVPSKYLNHDCW